MAANLQSPPSFHLRFEQGSIVIDGKEDPRPHSQHFQYDQRTLQYRSPANFYRETVSSMHHAGVSFQDDARKYQPLQLPLKQAIIPRPHQKEALNAWLANKGQGVVCLPTGAGKTILAVLAIQETKRPTLVVVPTIDLLFQWEEVLKKYFDQPIGILGGGKHDLQKITVSTYDSAKIHIEYCGNAFGFLIADECHHLGAPLYQRIAVASIAPFRLGLSATVERADGGEEKIYTLLGDLVYEGKIHEMVDQVLAPYDVISYEVELSDSEREQYTEAREKYRNFTRRLGLRMQDPTAWQKFIMIASRSAEGRDAMKAWREQKRLAHAAEEKLTKLWQILLAHEGEASIIFTEDNAMAYKIGCQFILPVLTHHTSQEERTKMLDAFRQREIRTLVTSKVLNEGVDVPEASVGVIISGSSSVREHVQRLGRILRHAPGKRAVLYEIVSKGTGEVFSNERRKQHHAYQRPT